MLPSPHGHPNYRSRGYRKYRSCKYRNTRNLNGPTLPYFNLISPKLVVCGGTLMHKLFGGVAEPTGTKFQGFGVSGDDDWLARNTANKRHLHRLAAWVRADISGLAFY